MRKVLYITFVWITRKYFVYAAYLLITTLLFGFTVNFNRTVQFLLSFSSMFLKVSAKEYTLHRMALYAEIRGYPILEKMTEA